MSRGTEARCGGHPAAPSGAATAAPAAAYLAAADLAADTGFAQFKAAAARGNLVPVYARLFADQLTPVTAYRCLVAADDREAPSFLFESVVNGTQQARRRPRGRPG